MTDMESAVNRDNRLFGHKIRALREAKRQEDPRRFTLCHFAAAVGISPTFMSRVERGDSNLPAADKIIKMAELLEVNADELLALANKVDPELEEIIREQPQAMSDLLRTVRGMSAEELRKLTERARRNKRKAAVAVPEVVPVAEFAAMAYPATDADKAICG